MGRSWDRTQRARGDDEKHGGALLRANRKYPLGDQSTQQFDRCPKRFGRPHQQSINSEFRLASRALSVSSSIGQSRSQARQVNDGAMFRPMPRPRASGKTTMERNRASE